MEVQSGASQLTGPKSNQIKSNQSTSGVGWGEGGNEGREMSKRNQRGVTKRDTRVTSKGGEEYWGG